MAWEVANNNNKPLSNKDMLLNRNKDMHLKKVTVQDLELELWLPVLVAHMPTIKPNKKKLTIPLKLNRTPSGNNACFSTRNSYLA